MLPKSLRPLLPYVKRYRWGYAAGTVCVFITNGIWILFPLVLGKAADDLHAGVTRHKLLVYAGLLLAIAITKGNLPVPHPLDRNRRLPRHRIRPAQRSVRAS
jgi:ABC-type multidrug transport system fused ATPase/permease subunit